MSEVKKSIQMYEVQGDTQVSLNPITDAKNVNLKNKENLPLNVETVEDVVNKLGALAFEDSIEIPEASTDTYGLALLSDDVLDDPDVAEANTAATTKAVSKVSVESVKVSGDQEVAGVKSFTDGIVVGNVKMTYTENAEAGVDEFTVDFLN